MTSRDFCFWLQGFFEINDAGDSANVKVDKGLIGPKVEAIKAHLSLVFKHEIDPSMGPPSHQAKLNHIHGERPDGTILRC